MSTAPLTSAAVGARLTALLLLAGHRLASLVHHALLLIPALRRRHEQRLQRHRAAVEAQRWADEVAVAAERAEEAAQRWQSYWRQTDEHADDAWHTWQDAEQRLNRTRAAAAFRTPDTLRTTSEYASRERFLHRAVADAVDRGDLPATVLADLAAGAGGWNPKLHPVEQELVLHRAIAAVRYHLYHQAAASEERIRHDAELADATRDSLRREVATAAGRAAALREDLIPEFDPASSPRLIPVF
ncbi:hypothetical protein [Actinoplanes sp. G11-F43]|uniref:hypothetical protein n=1 Tax=Actinoplanes sp. G11-F43 TaxID=3424130 RepID=UPI003D32E6B9